MPSGCIFGLVGPNGAGKTTTLRILMNLYQPSQGEVEVFGMNLWKNEVAIKKRIGFVSELRSLPDYMTGSELLKALKPLYERWNDTRIAKYVERFKVPMNRKIGTLSLGERTRVALVAAVAHDPDLLILDEPTNGLDALAREIFFKTLSEEYADSGGTVLMASNVIPEVERVCEAVGIIADGRLILSGNIEDLKMAVKMIQYTTSKQHDWANHPAVLSVERLGDVVTLITRQPPDGLLQEISSLQPDFVRVLDLNLTEIFVKLVEKWA